jgi:hypothetical protein
VLSRLKHFLIKEMFLTLALLGGILPLGLYLNHQRVVSSSGGHPALKRKRLRKNSHNKR